MIETPLHAGTQGLPMPDGIWSRPYRWLTLGLVLTVAAAAFESLSIAAGVLGIAVGTGIGGVIVGSAEAASGVSSMSITSQSLLMIGMLIIAGWIAGRLPTRARMAMEVDRAGMP